jgi:hypothetical protein
MMSVKIKGKLNLVAVGLKLTSESVPVQNYKSIKLAGIDCCGI